MIVEAAVVFPVVILVIFGMISITLAKYEDVCASCERHRADASAWFEDRGLHAEDALRARWLLREDPEE